MNCHIRSAVLSSASGGPQTRLRDLPEARWNPDMIAGVVCGPCFQSMMTAQILSLSAAVPQAMSIHCSNRSKAHSGNKCPHTTISQSPICCGQVVQPTFRISRPSFSSVHKMACMYDCDYNTAADIIHLVPLVTRCSAGTLSALTSRVANFTASSKNCCRLLS
jgi:hypothetical protein